jgi:hypothetical protein
MKMSSEERNPAPLIKDAVADTDTAKPGVAFTWPNGLLILSIVFGSYLLVIHDTTGLPRHIQVIQALGHCVWLMPFALYYNVEATPISRKLYVGANLLFVILIFALST